MFASIIAAIGSIGEILKTLKELVAFFKAVFGDDPAKFMRDSGTAFVAFHKANLEADPLKQKEAKIEALKQIQDLISRIP